MRSFHSGGSGTAAVGLVTTAVELVTAAAGLLRAAVELATAAAGLVRAAVGLATATVELLTAAAGLVRAAVELATVAVAPAAGGGSAEWRRQGQPGRRFQQEGFDNENQ